MINTIDNSEVYHGSADVKGSAFTLDLQSTNMSVGYSIITVPKDETKSLRMEYRAALPVSETIVIDGLGKKPSFWSSLCVFASVRINEI